MQYHYARNTGKNRISGYGESLSLLRMFPLEYVHNAAKKLLMLKLADG